MSYPAYLTDEQRKENRKISNKKWTAKNKDRLREKTKAYRYTLEGRLLWTYLNMKKRVEGRDAGKEHLYAGLTICSKEDFTKWSLQSSSYCELFSQWKKSGYIRKLVPSVDRKDTKQGYELSNMRWLTLSQNSKLGADSRWGNKEE